MLMVFARATVWLVTIVAMFVTVLPMTHSHQWWVRVWDFPRVHTFFTALLFGLIGLFIMRQAHLIAPILLLSCALYQGYRIFPYTPLARTQVALISDAGEERRIALLAANVLMENTNHDAVRKLIAREQPDVILLMETDATWQAALDGVLEDYSTVIAHPLDNHYGMIFATRLEAPEARMEFLVDDETPTLLAELVSRDGRRFNFVGLHPRPPVPGQDTDERDAQIRRAATIAQASGLPVVTMGDFNAPAWSWTARRFRHHGGFLDPRVGRGLISSFDANHAILRFPIDQLYVTPGIGLVSFARAENVGSDHFPMKAVLTIER